MENHKSCGAIVTRARKVLLIQGKKGHWGLPKGHQEIGETEEQTAIREVKEETGLDCSIVPGFRTVVSYTFIENGKEHHKDVVLFLAQSNSESFTLQPSEISDAKWLSFDEAIKRVTYHDAKDAIKKARDAL